MDSEEISRAGLGFPHYSDPNSVESVAMQLMRLEGRHSRGIILFSNLTAMIVLNRIECVPCFAIAPPVKAVLGQYFPKPVLGSNRWLKGYSQGGLTNLSRMFSC